MTLLRLTASAAAKEKRLLALAAAKGASEPDLRAVVEDAQLLGSLELAGVAASWEAVRASRRGEHVAPEIARLRAAHAAVPEAAALDRGALRAWHAAATGAPSAWRRAEREREPPPAPASRIDGRLEILEAWLRSDSVAKLQPSQAGALVLARLVEILPFDDANGRVSRLALAHAVRRAGGREPVLVGGDRARLQAALAAAFALDLAPLAALVEEAGERSLDVSIQALESGLV
jgi:hypothetical protein